MFQFRRFPSYTYEFSIWYMMINHVDCSIRKSADRCSLTAPRSLSQLTTSFFGSQCQGIHSALFIALPFVPGSIFAFSWIFTRCSFLPDLKYLYFLSFHLLTRSSSFAFCFLLFSFQVAFCSIFQEQILKDNFLSSKIYSQNSLLLLFFRKEHDTLRVFITVLCDLQRNSFFFCLLFFFQQKEK